MGEQQTHWETNILLLRTSVKKITHQQKKNTFISLINICLLLASGQGECKITAYKRDFDAGEDEAGALCRKKQKCHSLSFSPKRRFHYNHKLYILLRMMSKIITIQIVKEKDNRVLTNGMPLVALSSKNLDGLKKLPYSCDHFFRLV